MVIREGESGGGSKTRQSLSGKSSKYPTHTPECNATVVLVYPNYMIGSRRRIPRGEGGGVYKQHKATGKKQDLGEIVQRPPGGSVHCCLTHESPFLLLVSN